ncbi:MAG: endonuclease domain-containing protein, partial [Coriobacteriia bacterium]|nr:endonuclease domain-containing protein [Coriobacteriia bacterium]
NDRGFNDCLPLTDKTKLAAYLAQASGLRGHRQASRALQFVSENSASPMESVLAMLTSLPYRLGGYNLPMPLLNHRLDAPTTLMRNSGRSFFVCDQYYLEHKVDVEYDSDAFHAEAVPAERDLERRNALSALGVTVITVSWAQLKYVDKFDAVAKHLGRLLGKRIQLPPGFEKKRAELRKLVLPAVTSARSDSKCG